MLPSTCCTSPTGSIRSDKEDVRDQAIAAEERAEQAFNNVVDRFPKPKGRPLERLVNQRADTEATMNYVELIVNAYFSGKPRLIRRYQAHTKGNRELIQTVEISARLPHSSFNDLQLRRCLEQARSHVHRWAAADQRVRKNPADATPQLPPWSRRLIRFRVVLSSSHPGSRSTVTG